MSLTCQHLKESLLKQRSDPLDVSIKLAQLQLSGSNQPPEPVLDDKGGGVNLIIYSGGSFYIVLPWPYNNQSNQYKTFIRSGRLSMEPCSHLKSLSSSQL